MAAKRGLNHFQPCALRCGIPLYTQIKDLDKGVRLPIALAKGSLKMGQAWAKTSALPSRSLTLFQRANAHRVFGFRQQFFRFGAGFGCARLQDVFDARGVGNQIVVHIGFVV